MSIWYGRTEWHPTEQWFLKAKDLEKNVRRDFAMVHISNVEHLSPAEVTGIVKEAPEAAGSIEKNETADEKSAEGALLTEAKLYTDGGSRGNPGPSALGYALMDMEDSIIKKEGVYLGITTNNQAEYRGLERGLEYALDVGVKKLHVYMDSMLVVNQVKGAWKIKNQELLPLCDSIRDLMKKFDQVSLTHVPRALNKVADSIVNECLDSQGS